MLSTVSLKTGKREWPSFVMKSLIALKLSVISIDLMSMRGVMTSSAVAFLKSTIASSISLSVSPMLPSRSDSSTTCLMSSSRSSRGSAPMSRRSISSRIRSGVVMGVVTAWRRGSKGRAFLTIDEAACVASA